MKIIADTHVHTLASEHALSTVLENHAAAKEKGLRFLAITDHTGRMPGAPTDTYFFCLRHVLPKEYDGVYFLRGCEVNVLDEHGTLDLPDAILDQLEWVIASVHIVLVPPMSAEKTTEMWLNVARNPRVDVIGHCGDADYPFDYERVIAEFAREGKIVEINASKCRAGSRNEACWIKIAGLCAKHRVAMVISSDAHFAPEVGNVENALRILREAGVPEELVLNADTARFAKRISEMTGRAFEL